MTTSIVPNGQDIFWMRHAIELAKHAAVNQEVPVGAVLILDDKIIGEGSNCPITHNDPTAHAEIMALRQGAEEIKNYRIVESTLYVTLEPCIMCLGAIVHARVKRVVFGAYDLKTGALESAFQMGATDKFNHRIDYQGGVLASECAVLLSQFFQRKRELNRIKE